MTTEDRARYDRAARKASGTIIDSYSTSFGRAARLLQEPVRTHVRSIYGLVRLADEIVDGAFDAATPEEQATLLDELETETQRAVGRGFSTNVAVHAFALTARSHDIDNDLITPFFASMRTDLTRAEHDADSLAAYVYGSAEVVGLMCLRIFVSQGPTPVQPAQPHTRQARYEALAPGARALGAAFQKVNFLRDLAADRDDLGRAYFPDVSPMHLTDEQKNALLDDIDADLQIARTTLVHLPPSSRRGVLAAHGLFAELSARLRRTSAEQIRHTRVSVPTAVKARLLLAAIVDNARLTRRPAPTAPTNNGSKSEVTTA